MTVKELIKVSPSCDLVEITVREHGHGRWIQEYRIGKNAAVYPSEITEKLKERYQIQTRKRIDLKPGDEVDAMVYNYPVKVICRDVSKIPENIGRLKICTVQPRHIPGFHKEAMMHNDFSYEINCYPDGYTLEPKKKEKPQDDDLDGQMNIIDFLKNDGEVHR